MPNIYLRLPSSVVAFHRNRDDKHRLQPFVPLVLPRFTTHMAVLRDGLQAPIAKQVQFPLCYSQTEWNNMLAGRKPHGGEIVIQRDSSTWLTFQEICVLEGRKQSEASELYDFLCIQMPYEVLIGDRRMRTTASYNLTHAAAQIMQKLFVQDFQRALYEWELDTADFCIRPGMVIKRNHLDTLERFFLRYDIPVSNSRKERDSLRRQLDRWLKEANSLFRGYRNFDIAYSDPHDRIINV